MMNVKKILISVCFLKWLSAGEIMPGYIYPVDTIYHDDVLKICMLYQKHNGLELYFWNPVTQEATLGLLSFFQPTSLTVLPNKHAFSFIDNDRIKVKEVKKRSPKSVDLYGPYDLTTIAWIDNTNFYFSAKERRHHNLFHATIEGDLFRLTVSNTHHYLYPQKIDNELFFIEHTHDNEFAIKNIKYPTELLKQRIERHNQPVSLEEEVRAIIKNESSLEAYTPVLNIQDATTLIFFDKKTIAGEAIAFLHMTSLTAGFFIRYNDHIDKNQKSLSLDYYMMYYDEGVWKSKFIFTFSIPLHCIIQEKNKILMSESILPFLPYHHDSKIYFTQYDEKEEKLELYSYNYLNRIVVQESKEVGSHQMIFAPYFFNLKLICGGNILPNTKPYINLSSDGRQYFEMLEI
jgi:hypothetical protein